MEWFFWGLHRKKNGETAVFAGADVLTLSSPVPNTKVLTAFACKECGRFDSVGSGPKGDAMRCLEGPRNLWDMEVYPEICSKNGWYGWGMMGVPQWHLGNRHILRKVSAKWAWWKRLDFWRGRPERIHRCRQCREAHGRYAVMARRYFKNSNFRWFLSANHPGFGICFHLTAESRGCCQEQSRKLVDATETFFQPMQWGSMGCSSY